MTNTDGLFAVATRDEDALRRSIRLGVVGIGGAILLAMFNITWGWWLTSFTVFNAVFLLVACAFLIAFGIRTWKAKRILQSLDP